MYAVGNDPRLGAWDATRGVPLSTSPFLKGVWTGYVDNLPTDQKVEWKCVRIHPQASDLSVEWQPGGNNYFQTPASGGFYGMTVGGF